MFVLCEEAKTSSVCLVTVLPISRVRCIFSDDIQDEMYPDVAADEDPGLHREARDDDNPCNYRISDTSGEGEY